jgi:hypothetical protein
MKTKQPMKKYISKKGVSFMLVAGNYGGFHISLSSSAFHFCIAFIAFTVFFYDVENAIGRVLEKEKAIQIRIIQLEELIVENANKRKGNTHKAEEYSKLLSEEHRASNTINELKKLIS